ncbi:MAG: thymidylate synthase [Clostridia bacterium]|jgi:thymidylate synthase|nr:thymidylate synthase [Clostridia bacterium]
MSLYDEKYLELVDRILKKGYFNNNRTGIPTYKLPHQILQFNLEEEFPILTTKFVAFKTAVKELLWIFQKQSNDVKELQKDNVHIWDEWEMEDGTIGTSYGWVVKEFKQIDKLIEQLKTNPQDRRMMINLWQIPYLDTGALYPCVFNSCWDVTEDKLNCMLTIRSNDIPLGNPFNVVQYAVLIHLLAQVTGHKPGLLTVCISNAHIYENQIQGMKIQLSRKNQAMPAPKLWINPEIKNFYDFTIEDIKLIDYKHLGKIEMEVSV